MLEITYQYLRRKKEMHVSAFDDKKRVYSLMINVGESVFT
jgi:hypothetical protein